MRIIAIVLTVLFALSSCNKKTSKGEKEDTVVSDSLLVEEEKKPSFTIDDIVIEKELQYDQHTLADSYPYKDTVRVFQWDKIRESLFFLDSIQQEPTTWVVLQNYKNLNGEGPVARNWQRNEYKRVSDQYNVERYQSVPLFLPFDRDTAERYGRDGWLGKYIKDTADYVKLSAVLIPEEWLVPKRYVKMIGDTVSFHHAVVVDRKNQNIATFEKVGDTWKVRSMNPSTTGLHNPPYGHDTPLGMFVVQEKKAKMIYLKDGSTETGGFAPWASRFTNGAYLHGVPVNAPNKQMIEFSTTLGTTPRSHMCVRNATSHAKFMYDWAPTLSSVVIVIE